VVAVVLKGKKKFAFFFCGHPNCPPPPPKIFSGAYARPGTGMLFVDKAQFQVHL